MASIPSASSFPLFWRLTRRHFQEEPARFLLTIFGIALGIALMVAIRLANGAAMVSFHDSVDLMAGRTNLSLSALTSPLPETLLKELSEIRQQGEMLPVIEAKMAPADNPKAFLTVLGVDLLKDNEARDVEVLGGQNVALTPAQMLQLLPQDDAVFLSKKYADSKGYRVGQKIPFLVNDHTQVLSLAGLLNNKGAGRALGRYLGLDGYRRGSKSLQQDRPVGPVGMDHSLTLGPGNPAGSITKALSRLPS